MFENWTYISVLQFLNLYIKDNKTFRKMTKKCSFLHFKTEILIHLYYTFLCLSYTELLL